MFGAVSTCLLAVSAAAVSLLDRATAAKLAGKKQQQQQQQQPQRSKAGQQQLDETIASAPALAALSEAGLDPIIARCMAKLGFLEPTPIQSAAWGPAAAGRDVLGHAEPGRCCGCTSSALMITVAIARRGGVSGLSYMHALSLQAVSCGLLYPEHLHQAICVCSKKASQAHDVIHHFCHV